MTEAPTQPLRVLSIDVEEYFHIEAAYHSVGPKRWDQWPSRVEASVDRLLQLFTELGRPATFFILGDVARRCPTLAPRIAEAGHEIASHGFMHDRLHRLDPDSFREDLGSSKRLLEDQTGAKVVGYRAPTFSVTRHTAWAIDVLLELGFEYDSSVFPVVHPAYGEPAAPTRPFLVQGRPGGGRLLEIPPLTWRAIGRNLAVAGGGYFRLLPLTLMRRGLAQAAADGRPAVLYFHPWEFDPKQPRMPLPAVGRLRTYTGLKSALDKLRRIGAMPGQWTTMAEIARLSRDGAEQGEPFLLGASPAEAVA